MGHGLASVKSPNQCKASTAVYQNVASRPEVSRSNINKMCIRDRLGLAAGLSNERDRFADIMKTDDALEGATAFAEKRNPHFQGR